MNQELMFIGYKKFVSKKGIDCFILEFLSNPVTFKNGCYCKPISVFTDANSFNDFINNNKIFDYVTVDCYVVGDRLHYSI